MTAFTGPLMLVGLPRSGTKLLRDLINRHPDISIPVSESQFIPYLLKKIDRQLPKSESELIEVYETFAESPFFGDMTARENITLEKETFIKNADTSSWEGVLGYILKYYGPKGASAKIYGDKTPQYLYRIKLLKETFPNAKFIHIIRDPRDYAVSVKNIWGKHIYRAAENWRHEIKKARKEAELFKNDYLEIKYESLLNDPAGTMQQICEFTGCTFDEKMLTLAKPSENYGAAKGKATIVTTNKNKYKQALTHDQIRRIEEITYDTLQDANYSAEFAQHYKPIGSPQKMYYKMHDAINSAQFHIRERGLIKGIDFFIRFHKLTAS